jgi:acid phosphatase (class A)
MRLITVSILVTSLAAAVPSQGQQPASAAASNAPAQPYLARTMAYPMILSDPPKAGSPIYAADDEVVEALQNADDARYASAQADATQLYPRFEATFGRPIGKDTSPALVHLLDRAIADVNAVAFPAKDHFGRPRPFQRLHLRRVCGLDKLPAPSPTASGGSSYPSGHSTWGWTTAMVLARVDPSRTAALMSRAAEYAESRLVCGVHYPSDIEAGHAVAAAVVAELDGNANFRADLERAREELAAQRR